MYSAVFLTCAHALDIANKVATNIFSSVGQKEPKKGGEKQEKTYAWMSRAICHQKNTILDS